jgi:hypothetical protein
MQTIFRKIACHSELVLESHFVKLNQVLFDENVISTLKK